MPDMMIETSTLALSVSILTAIIMSVALIFNYLEIKYYYQKHIAILVEVNTKKPSIKISIRNDDEQDLMLDRLCVYCYGKEFPLSTKSTPIKHNKDKNFEYDENQLKTMKATILEYINAEKMHFFGIFKIGGGSKGFSFKLLIRSSGQTYITKKWIATELIIGSFTHYEKIDSRKISIIKRGKKIKRYKSLNETYAIKRRHFDPTDKDHRIQNIAILMSAFLLCVYLFFHTAYPSNFGRIVTLLCISLIIDFTLLHQTTSGRINETSISWFIIFTFNTLFIFCDLLNFSIPYNGVIGLVLLSVIVSEINLMIMLFTTGRTKTQYRYRDSTNWMIKNEEP